MPSLLSKPWDPTINEGICHKVRLAPRVESFCKLLIIVMLVF